MSRKVMTLTYMGSFWLRGKVDGIYPEVDMELFKARGILCDSF